MLLLISHIIPTILTDLFKFSVFSVWLFGIKHFQNRKKKLLDPRRLRMTPPPGLPSNLSSASYNLFPWFFPFQLLPRSGHFSVVFGWPFNSTLKPQSNGPLYSNTVIGTLACYIWYSKEGPGGLWPRPVSSLLYQM